MKFEEAKAIRNSISNKVDFFGNKLKEFETNEMGLVPDKIRKTDEHQMLSNNFDKSFKELQDFNKIFIKTFKKEIQQERINKRKNLQK